MPRRSTRIKHRVVRVGAKRDRPREGIVGIRDCVGTIKETRVSFKVGKARF